MTVSLEEQLAPLVAQLAKVQEGKAALQQTEDALKARLRALVPIAGTYPAGGLTLQVQTQRRFDPAAGAEHLTSDQLTACTTTVLDPKLVKALLTPAQLDAAMVVSGEPKLVLR